MKLGPFSPSPCSMQENDSLKARYELLKGNLDAARAEAAEAAALAAQVRKLQSDLEEANARTALAASAQVCFSARTLAAQQNNFQAIWMCYLVPSSALCAVHYQYQTCGCAM